MEKKEHVMIGLNEILEARDRIGKIVSYTPLLLSHSLSAHVGVPVSLKLDHRQPTGSFKLRGASNAIMALTPEERSRGVVAFSTGNYGRGLAFAAHALGSRATICMSRLVPENKVSEIRRLGADVRIVGTSQDEAQREAERLVTDEGLMMVSPIDDPNVVAGQGTVGLEIAEEMPDVVTVLVPLSGGGLASGVAAAIKAIQPSARVIGISMERGAAMKASLDAGRPVLVEEVPSLADSLGGGIGLDNRITFQMCRDLLDEVVLLNEEQIATGIRHAYFQEREIVEGAGAVGIGALLADVIRKPLGPISVVVTGRNIDMGLHTKVVNGDDLRNTGFGLGPVSL